MEENFEYLLSFLNKYEEFLKEEDRFNTQLFNVNRRFVLNIPKRILENECEVGGNVDDIQYIFSFENGQIAIAVSNDTVKILQFAYDVSEKAISKQFTINPINDKWIDNVVKYLNSIEIE